MKKQTSAVAIIVAVIFSIVLFPFIVVTGISSGVIFSMESVFQQNREEEIYQSFVKSGGEEYIYELLLEGAESEIGEFDVDPEEFFPREQVNTMIDDIYHALLKGEKYQVDLSIQKEVTKKYARREFDANIEIEIEKALKDEYGAAYDLLSESEKQELIQTATVEARNIFEEEIDSAVEAEFSALEKEFSAEINGIYDTSESGRIPDARTQRRVCGSIVALPSVPSIRLFYSRCVYPDYRWTDDGHGKGTAGHFLKLTQRGNFSRIYSRGVSGVPYADDRGSAWLVYGGL